MKVVRMELWTHPFYGMCSFAAGVEFARVSGKGNVMVKAECGDALVARGWEAI